MLETLIGSAAGKSKNIVSIIAATTTMVFAVQPSQSGTLNTLSFGRTCSDLPLIMSNAHGMAKEMICSMIVEFISALNAVEEMR